MVAQQRELTSHPPERGRSASEARRVGVTGVSRFDKSPIKTALARRLRHASTDVEMRLWQKLRNKQLGFDFRRQHPVGQIVLDFYCAALRLAIELDGGQHNAGDQEARDRRRDDWLAARGVTVLRFWNSDVTRNLSGVSERIKLIAEGLYASNMTPTRRWRADLPLSGGGTSFLKRR
jgi:very-short-patch-repair endonuclease